MLKPLIVQFNNGIQFPPKLGSLILKPTAKDKLAYAQNIDSLNDEYGNGVITPGPALVTITNNSQLNGVPTFKAFFGSSALGTGFLYFLQGLLGTKSTIRRVKNVVSGQVPEIDTSGAVITAAFFTPHNAHTNLELVDVVLRPDSNGNFYLYISGKDDVDTWVARIDVGSGGLSTTVIATNADFTDGLTSQFLVLGDDNLIYWIGQRRVSSINTADSYTINALVNGLPLGTYASCGATWNNFLAVAVSTDAYGDFGRRLSAGSSYLVLWDYTDDNFIKKIQAPCRYISAMVVDPSGNLLCFGGVDEGKTSIYEFSGYGFNLLYTYIGDMPRSRHSIEFDSQGRILWLTADGQLCRFSKNTGIFDHLNTVSDNAMGGLLAKSIGSPIGNEFLLGFGSGTTYTMKRVVFGNYSGDGGGSDGSGTPLGVSGIQQVPDNTTIAGITLRISRPLASGEKIVLSVYVNGSSTPIEYSTLDFSIDGAITAKRQTSTISNVNNFSLGVKWKMADGQATAPAIMPAEVEFA